MRSLRLFALFIFESLPLYVRRVRVTQTVVRSGRGPPCALGRTDRRASKIAMQN